jgi:hypothetical protein
MILEQYTNLWGEFSAAKLGIAFPLYMNTMLAGTFPALSALEIVKLQQHHRVKFTYLH